jgi:hypothetical protein
MAMEDIGEVKKNLEVKANTIELIIIIKLLINQN